MSGVTELDEAGQRYIAGWEGGQSADGLYRAYWDPYGKIWTIGIGETASVHPGEVWTAAEAWADLERQFADNYAWAINNLNVEFNANQFNALADYVWNCGAGALKLYGVEPYLLSHDWEGAADALLHPDTSGGVVLSDLVRRRQSERMLFLTPAPIVVTDPYAIYPKETVHFEGRSYSEYELAKAIDEYLKHPKLEHHGLVRLLPVAKDAKLRVWVLSVFEPPEFKVRRAKPDWDDHRGGRYQLWAKRVERMENALKDD